jgi:multidrug resistance efflux pump
MRNTVLAGVLLKAGALPAFAASEADYKAAFAAAEAAEKQADQLRNKWTTTEAQLAAAKKAAAGGDFDAATAAAKEAEALAKASIFQATSEKERWKDLEIH